MASVKNPLEVHGASFTGASVRRGRGRGRGGSFEAFPLPPPAELSPDYISSAAVTPTHSPGRPTISSVAHDHKALFSWSAPPPMENLIPQASAPSLQSPSSSVVGLTPHDKKEPFGKLEAGNDDGRFGEVPIYSEQGEQGIAANCDRDELAQTGILALRKWLEVKCGPLSTVAKQIRSFDPAGLHPLVTCAAVDEFLASQQCAAVNDGTLDCIFECLDPQRLGVIDLDDLLGPMQQLIDSERGHSHSLQSEVENAKMSSSNPGALHEIMQLAQKEEQARMLEAELLGEEHWGLVRSIFYSIAGDGCDEVVVQILLSKLRDDYRVRSSGLLDRVLPYSRERVLERESGDKRTTFAQGLEHVEAHLLQTISWERFRCLLLEAPRNRRPTIDELMHMEAAEPSSGSRHKPANTALDSSDFNPNRNPEKANQWMESALGVDGAMLRKIFGLFLHCQKGASPSSPVRRGEFVRLLQKTPAMMASFANTPLCVDSDTDRIVRPQVWGEVLVHLNCHESDVLTWADVLEVIRWHCDLCFDRVPAMAVGPGGYKCGGFPGPAFSNGRSKNRLTKLIVGCEEGDVAQTAESPKQPSSAFSNPDGFRFATGESPRQSRDTLDMAQYRYPGGALTNAEPSSPVAAISGLFDKSTRPTQPTSLVAAVDGLFEKALHGASPQSGRTSKPQRKGAHPFVDYDSDGDIDEFMEDTENDPAAVARLLAEAQRRKHGEDAKLWQNPSAVGMPNLPAVSNDLLPERNAKQTKLRIRVGAHHLGVSSVEHLEKAVAEILQLSPSSVRLAQ